MRVAALYDIHGNLPALDAVLAEVPADARVLLGGDHVYGPFPAETLELLRALGERAIWLRGNCDRELSEPGAGPASLDVLDWVRDRLTPEQVQFLYELPEAVALEVDTLGQVFFCHATPSSDVAFFTEATPEERLVPMFADVVAGTVVCGHSHLQFTRTIGGTHVVNAGSVGMAYEDAPGAYWALLGPTVELRHTLFEPASLMGIGYPRAWPTIGRKEATSLLDANGMSGSSS